MPPRQPLTPFQQRVQQIQAQAMAPQPASQPQQQHPQVRQATQAGAAQAQQNYQQSQQIDPRSPGGVKAVINQATQGMRGGSVYTPAQQQRQQGPPQGGWANRMPQPQPVGTFQQGGMRPQPAGPAGNFIGANPPPQQQTPMPYKKGSLGERAHMAQPGLIEGPWETPGISGNPEPRQEMYPGPNYEEQPGPGAWEPLEPFQPYQPPPQGLAGGPNPYYRGATPPAQGQMPPGQGGDAVPFAQAPQGASQGALGRQGPVRSQDRRLVGSGSGWGQAAAQQQGAPVAASTGRPAQVAPETAGALAAAGVGQGAANPNLGLPFSKEFEDAKHALNNELQQTLTNLGIQEAQLPLMMQKVKERLKYQHGLEMEDIDESMNDRGILRSSIRDVNRMRASSPYQQREQDLDTEFASQAGALKEARFGAQAGHERSLADLAYRYASQLYDNPTSAIDQSDEDYYEQPGFDGRPNDERHGKTPPNPGKDPINNTRPQGKTRGRKPEKKPKKSKGKTRGRK